MTRFIAPPRPAAPASLVARATRAVLRATIDLARALRDRHEVKRLVELDDRMLKDIGLSRAQVDGALAESFFRSPSAVLVRSVERRPRTAAAPAVKPVRPVVPVVKQACPA